MSRVEAQLKEIAGVVGVHDLHVWTVTSGMESATAHLSVAGADDTSTVLAKARACLAEHGIEHATVQIETAGAGGDCGACGDSSW
jgi:cobalt-zinc-cadmium efflux system protein